VACEPSISYDSSVDALAVAVVDEVVELSNFVVMGNFSSDSVVDEIGFFVTFGCKRSIVAKVTFGFGLPKFASIVGNFSYSGDALNNVVMSITLCIVENGGNFVVVVVVGFVSVIGRTFSVVDFWVVIGVSVVWAGISGWNVVKISLSMSSESVIPSVVNSSSSFSFFSVIVVGTEVVVVVAFVVVVVIVVVGAFVVVGLVVVDAAVVVVFAATVGFVVFRVVVNFSVVVVVVVVVVDVCGGFRSFNGIICTIGGSLINGRWGFRVGNRVVSSVIVGCGVAT